MLDEIETGTTIFLYEILDHWKYAESCNSLLEHINMGKYRAVRSVLECSKKYGLLSNDAVHLATVKRHGITNIATNDRDFERTPWLNIRKS